MQDRERGRSDLPGDGAQPRSESARERRLPDPEVPHEIDDVVGSQLLCQGATDRLGLRLALGPEVLHAFGPGARGSNLRHSVE